MNTEKVKVQETLIKMLNAVDSNDFERAKNQFTDIVFSDYSELNGVIGMDVESNQMVDQWKAFLEPVTSSHMVTNFDISIDKNEAQSYSHFYARHEFDNIPYWDVYGRYFNTYKKINNEWKISSTKVFIHGHRGNLNFYNDVQEALKNS